MIELLGALDARVQLGLEVHLQVRDDVGAAAKGAIAYGAGEGTHVQVDFDVGAQVLAPRELALAHVALEGPEARVDADVDD